MQGKTPLPQTIQASFKLHGCFYQPQPEQNHPAIAEISIVRTLLRKVKTQESLEPTGPLSVFLSVGPTGLPNGGRAGNLQKQCWC